MHRSIKNITQGLLTNWYFVFFFAFFSVNVLILLRARFYYGYFLHGTDAQMYYAYARSILFDWDIDFKNDFALTPFPELISETQAPLNEIGRVSNRYPMGVGLVILPFLVLGHLATIWINALFQTSFSQMGYSDIHLGVVAISLVALETYCSFLLAQFLKNFVSIRIALASVVLIWFGTSLLYYGAIFPFMSHGIGFALLSALLYFLKKVEPERSQKLAIISGLLAGLLAIIRPTNVVLFIPYAVLILCRLLKNRQRPLVFLFLLSSSVFPLSQLIVWRRLYGKWFVYSYGEEGFNWASPELFKTYFSSNHGLFYFAPIALLSFLGLFIGVKEKKFRAESLSAMLSIILASYLNAAWHSWFFGQAFGARAFCESGVWFAFGLSILLSRLHVEAFKQRLTYSVAAGCVAWNIFLLALFVKGIIPPVGEFNLLKLF